MSDPQTTEGGPTFRQINGFAHRLHHGFPTPLPALSDTEAAALVGALKALWTAEAREKANG